MKNTKELSTKTADNKKKKLVKHLLTQKRGVYVNFYDDNARKALMALNGGLPSLPANVFFINRQGYKTHSSTLS